MTDTDTAKAKAEGRAAYAAGVPLYRNKYENASIGRKWAWRIGWREAELAVISGQQENIMSDTPTPGLIRAVPGPWVAESQVSHDPIDRGLAVIAVTPEAKRTPRITPPTRGMVAWINSGMGASDTDDQAVATARLIAAAPDLLDALKGLLDFIAIDKLAMNALALQTANEAVRRAEGNGYEK